MTQQANIADKPTLEDSPQTLRQLAWNSNRFIPMIIEKLKEIKPCKIILFGSHASGKPKTDSDIDLIVVLDKKGVAKTYQEKLQNRMIVGKTLLPIERVVPLDTLVYTRDEWDLFLGQKSSFSKLIRKTGIVLYEADNPEMAQPSQG